MSNTLPMAGAKLFAFLNTPMGEEVTEGVLGGSLAGGALLGTDTPLEQIALQTALAMGGGVGFGMAGRRVGEMIGNQIHKDPLKNQQGLLASAARIMGNETTMGGIKEQSAVFKDAMQNLLYKQKSAEMMEEAIKNPAEFAAKYGIDSNQFRNMAPNVTAGREAAQLLETLNAIPPEMKQSMIEEASKNYKPQIDQYRQIEKLVGDGAAGNIDDQINKLITKFDKFENDTSASVKQDQKMVEQILGGKGSEVLRSLSTPTKPITGGNVGRMIGRFLGDEIGVLSGMAAGGVLAQGMGIESAKDVQIRKLQEQLNQRNS